MKTLKYLSFASLLAFSGSAFCMEQKNKTNNGKTIIVETIPALKLKLQEVQTQLKKSQKKAQDHQEKETEFGQKIKEQIASHRDALTKQESESVIKYAPLLKAKLEEGKTIGALAKENELREVLGQEMEDFTKHLQERTREKTKQLETELGGYKIASTRNHIAKIPGKLRQQYWLDKTVVAVPAMLTLFALNNTSNKNAKQLIGFGGLATTAIIYYTNPLQTERVQNTKILKNWLPIVAAHKLTQKGNKWVSDLDAKTLKLCPQETQNLQTLALDIQSEITKYSASFDTSLFNNIANIAKLTVDDLGGASDANLSQNE